MSPHQTDELAALLRHRLTVIADHALRDRDPAAHLQALAAASHAIDDWTRAHADTLPPRLRHFLENASFDKALALVEG
jgi:hypothetical protein